MLTNKTIRGAAWTVFARLFGRLIDFGLLLILSRFLSPADFGLMALATTVVAVVDTVLEVPIIQALTRLDSIDAPLMDTAFTLGLVRALVLVVIMVGCALPFSWIYHDVRLFPLVSALAIGPISRGLYSPGMALEFRDMKFGSSSAVLIAGKIVALAVCLSVLFAGGGYWALAVNNMAASFVTTALTYIIAPYRPRLTLSRFSSFAGFAGWFSLSQIVSALSWQLDRAIIGRFVPQAVLGRYSVAGDLATLPTQSLIGPAMQPVMSAMARIGNDPPRLRGAVLKAGRVAMGLAVPASVVIAMTADLIVRILFDARWADSTDYLRGLSIALILSSYYQPVYSMALATDRPRIIFNLNAADIGLRVVVIPLGLYLFSLWGAIGARGVLAVWGFSLCLLCVKKYVGASILEQLLSLAPVVVGAGAMALAMGVVRAVLPTGQMHVILQEGVVCAAGGIAYGLVLFGYGLRPSHVFQTAS
jgi:PST family polysaccharide transporter